MLDFDDIRRVDTFGTLFEMFDHEWFNQTTVHPLGLLAVIVLGGAMLLLPRRYALIPMIIMACFIAPAQRFVVLTLDFNFLRVMVVAGLLRVILRNEVFLHRWRGLDTAVVLWSVTSTIVYSLLRPDFSATIMKLGYTFDAMGMYFLFRFLVRDWNDIALITKYFIFISVPVAGAFIIESITARNLFSIFGGVPEVTDMRQGRLRVQGAFAHPIIAGIFWASLIPFAFAFYRQPTRSRWLSWVALVTFSIIIYTTASSTPIAAAMICVFMMFLYPLRRYRHLMKWGAIGTLIALELVMNNHVWHLFSRIDFVGGSTGWYRYYLVELFIENFSSWWLVGTTDFYTWGAFPMGGVTNQYVWEGINGGLITLLAFVYMMYAAARAVGRLVRVTEGDKARSRIAWAMGVSLLAHSIIFFNTNYFGQITMVWFLLLACIGSMHALECMRSNPVPKTAAVSRRRFLLPEPAALPRPPRAPRPATI